MTRSELDSILRTTIGSTHVYFQPSESVKIKYPCVIYKLDNIPTLDADDLKYKMNTVYQLIYVTKSPTDPNVHKLAMLPRSSFERFYTIDELNHYVYRIYT